MFFLEFPWLFCDAVNVGNLISGSSAFSKPSLSIWKFLVHVLLKPSLKVFCIPLLAFKVIMCVYLVLFSRLYLPPHLPSKNICFKITLDSSVNLGKIGLVRISIGKQVFFKKISLFPDSMNCKPMRLLCPWGFSRQKYWSGSPFLPPGDLPDPGQTCVPCGP